MNVTVVTSWYRISSKYSTETYLEWINRFLSIPCNLIIFTDTVEDFAVKRENVRVIHLDISDFETSKYDDYWKYCEHIDIERKSGVNHSVKLYKLWAEKVFLCNRAVKLNPFGTEYFCWCDIGIVRQSDMFPMIYSFPCLLPRIQNKNKIMISQIEPFENSDTCINSNGISNLFLNIDTNTSCRSVIRIQGGFFSGSTVSIAWYAKLYRIELELFVKENVLRICSLHPSWYLLNIE